MWQKMAPERGLKNNATLISNTLAIAQMWDMLQAC